MIPKNANLVYEGEIFKVYNWQQKLFDNTFKTFEFVERKGSVQLIVKKDDKLILLEEETPEGEKFASLPGGMVEWDEPPEKAAERELLEETGLKAELKFLEKNSFKGKVKWDTHYYICKNAEKVKEPVLDAGERIKVLELTFEKFIERTQRNDFRNKHFQNKIKLLSLENKLNTFKKLLF